MNDGTQERTLDPPHNSLSDAEMRECERAAREGFDAMDQRSRAWLDEQLADTPHDLAQLARCAMGLQRKMACKNEVLDFLVLTVRDRYAVECVLDYAEVA